ncbi:MAG: (Fe-S)-binding protein, partial [Candidatus Marinimicrobia bacterium]|nr:(Fe-S)-binding protein [Candidatus Neomarinimicrobiota bacterium]
PCYLGRRNDIYDLPRDILKAVPGINLVEFPNTRDNALCCGGGGGRMWLETPPEERFSNQRLKEAADIEVNSIITSCPYCVINFEDSAKYLKMKDCQVLEVIELVNMAAE